MRLALTVLAASTSLLLITSAALAETGAPRWSVSAPVAGGLGVVAEGARQATWRLSVELSPEAVRAAHAAPRQVAAVEAEAVRPAPGYSVGSTSSQMRMAQFFTTEELQRIQGDAQARGIVARPAANRAPAQPQVSGVEARIELESFGAADPRSAKASRASVAGLKMRLIADEGGAVDLVSQADGALVAVVDVVSSCEVSDAPCALHFTVVAERAASQRANPAPRPELATSARVVLSGDGAQAPMGARVERVASR